MQSWTIADFPALARLSLHAWVVALLGAPSCLVTSVTEYPEPVPSPPFVDANTALATPKGETGVPVTRILRVDDNVDQVTFTADVRAEDNGRPRSARVFVNYKLSPEEAYLTLGGGDTLPPDTFDSVRRIGASLQLPPGKLADGCYQVTFVVTHEFDSFQLIPVMQNDTAVVVWWMIKGDPAQVNMASCPGLPASSDAGLPGDSGADAN